MKFEKETGIVKKNFAIALINSVFIGYSIPLGNAGIGYTRFIREKENIKTRLVFNLFNCELEMCTPQTTQRLHKLRRLWFTNREKNHIF